MFWKQSLQQRTIEANEEDLKKESEKMARSIQMEVDKIEGIIPESGKRSMKKDIADPESS